MIYTTNIIEGLVRAELNEYSEETVSSSEILAIINFGYRDIATRGLCIERDEGAVTRINSNLIKLPSWRKINYVELVSFDNSVVYQDTLDVIFQDTDDVTFFKTELVSGFARRSIPCELPSVVGYKGWNGPQPQAWFQWGDFLYIEPLPTARYLFILYFSDLPTLPIVQGEPIELPMEFCLSLVMFTTSTVSIKLRRWADVVRYYNQYILLLQTARNLQIKKKIDSRSSHVVPDSVGVKNGQRG
jgi:hypothetical protein